MARQRRILNTTVPLVRQEDSGNGGGISRLASGGSTFQKTRRRNLCCWCLLPLLLLYFAIPVAIRLSVNFQGAIVFCQYLYCPLVNNLSNPESYGAPQETRNFFLTTGDNETLGVWHILPQNFTHKGLRVPQTSSEYEHSLSSGHPVVVYLHGNAGSREGAKAEERVLRCNCFTVLASLGCHILTFDYRGFADSTGWPTNESVVSDAMMVWLWTKHHSGNAPVYLWGHSLGSGISVQLASRLCKQDSCPDRLVLEAPFTSIQDGALTHPFSLPYRPLLLSSAVKDLFFDDWKVQFNSLMSIEQVSSSTMILHGDNDNFIAYEQGQQLYEKLRSVHAQQGQNDVFFVAAPGFGHRNLHAMPNLPSIIQTFFEGQESLRQLEEHLSR